MATFIGLQSRLPLNLTHLLSPRSYLNHRVSQLHNSAYTQRFWTLLYLDNQPHGDETPSKHQRKQHKREDVVTSDRYYCGPPLKNLVVPASKRCVFVRDDVALPITNALRGFFDNTVVNVEKSADKLREELPSWWKLKNRQDPYGPRWKPCPEDPYDPCPKPCPPPTTPAPKRKTIPTYPTDPCRRSPKPTTCRRTLTFCDRKSRYYWSVGPPRWSRRYCSSLAAGPIGSITRLGKKNQLLAECWRTRNSGIHVSAMTSGKRTSGNEDSGTGDKDICARGTKKKKNKKKKKKKKKKSKLQEGRTICTGGGKNEPQQICTTPRNNPAKVSQSSPRNDIAEISNRAPVNDSGSETTKPCEPDLGWKNSTCPGFPGGTGTCSTNKPGCGRTEVPLPTVPPETRRQFVEPPKRDERVNVKSKELGEEKKKDKETQEKPKDSCNSDWCPGKGAGSCSTNKPQCTGGGTSRRSYSTLVLRPWEYKLAKLPFIPTRSMRSSKFSHRERKDHDKTNPQHKDDIVKKEISEIEECLTSVRCPRPKKTKKSNSGKSERDKK